MAPTSDFFANAVGLFPLGQRPVAGTDFETAAPAATAAFLDMARTYLSQVIQSEELLDVHEEQLAYLFGVTPRQTVEAVPEDVIDRVRAVGVCALTPMELLWLAFDPAALAILQPFSAEVFPQECLVKALEEASTLPAAERPTSIGELARWVKTRVFGREFLPADRMTEFLTAFGLEQLRHPAAEPVSGWSNGPVGPVRTTAFAQQETTAEGRSVVLRAIESLLDTDRAVGELLVMFEYAEQPKHVLAALTGLDHQEVDHRLNAATSWVRRTLKQEATIPAG